MNRAAALAKLGSDSQWDVIVIGGGASGLGVALDAVTRGLKTLLLEAHDFAKGTSSRSTKLVHGGVRYLAQGDVRLVREALYERGLLARNAAHLFHTQRFVVPTYRRWEAAYYGLGFGIYDALAGRLSLGRTQRLSAAEVLAQLPTLAPQGLRGGVAYYDGQFDDARLAINLAQTIVEQGGTVLNHMCVVELIKETAALATSGAAPSAARIAGVVARDGLPAATAEAATAGCGRYELRARVVVNATGIFTNDILAMADPARGRYVTPSQGVHLVLDASFLGGGEALMIPKTSDGRVLFVLPWAGRVLVGTTDTPLAEVREEPRALESEIAFLLETAGQYLARKPTRADVLSVFAGLRPLAAPKAAAAAQRTKEISRSHKLLVSAPGLLSLIGGKWTTYRKMAEDCVDRAIELAGLPPRPCVTRSLAIHGSPPAQPAAAAAKAAQAKAVRRPAAACASTAAPPTHAHAAEHRRVYGSDLAALSALEQADPALAERLHPAHAFTLAEALWAIRHEMAESLEDVLARRVRLLFVDARAAIEAAPQVAQLFVRERAWSAARVAAQLAEFTVLARGYLLAPTSEPLLAPHPGFPEPQ